MSGLTEEQIATLKRQVHEIVRFTSGPDQAATDVVLYLMTRVVMREEVEAAEERADAAEQKIATHPEEGALIQVGMWPVRIRYDSTLDRRGQADMRDSPYSIVLREWDERVFLHEVLHVVLNRWLSKIGGKFDGLPAWEKATQEAEAALWEMGWRWQSNPSALGDQVSEEQR